MAIAFSYAQWMRWLPASVILAAVPVGARAADQVNVYSYREPGLIQPLLKTFTEETGIRVNFIFAKDGLVERMVAEGRNSPVDVLLTNESGLLFQAEASGVTQGLQDATLEAAVPATLRDPKGHWFALTRRARVVYASRERVGQGQITYEELAEPKWRGKICIRSGQHTYNIALIASMIAHHGEAKAEAWLKGLKENLARKPAGGDREAVRDVYSGQCDVAVGNTYYMVAMLKNAEQKAWADSVKILFPNAADRGTHVNISGMALAAHAPDKDAAIKLMHFLVSPKAQQMYAEANGEYPVVAGAEAPEVVKGWGVLKADDLGLDKIGALRKAASELVDKVGFDAGN